MVTMTTPAGGLGTIAPPFDLLGVDGRHHTRESCRGPKGLVVMFICNHCPYVKAVIGRIIRDTLALASHGVGSVAIMSNDASHYPEDAWDNMVRIAQALAFPFPYLLDADQSVARAYGAVCTPDFFGYNEALALQYRGRLDASKKEAAPESTPRELFDAMRMIALTGQGPSTQMPSIGCSIKWRSEPI